MQRGRSNRDFDLRALYDALDEQRRARGLTWAAVGREVNRFRTFMRPIAVSTITSVRDKPVGEGDGILQMLLWLGRTPESFVPGFEDANGPVYRLPELAVGQILRWDTRAIHAALNARRAERAMRWADVAGELRGYTPASLTNLATGGRTGFPHVMRLVEWLGQPAVTFTRVARW